MPSDFLKVLETIMLEARPDVDLRPHTPAYDILLLPHNDLLRPIVQAIEKLKASQSLLSTDLADTEADLLSANQFIYRILGDRAVGPARIHFTAPTSVVIPVSATFTADNGAVFRVVSEFTFPESLMRLNKEGTLYYVDVPIVATEAGARGRIAAHTLSSLQGTALNFVKVDNPFPFSGGADRETTTELLARAADSITERSLVSGRGVRTQLRANFPFISNLFVAGFGDEEQSRDIFEGVHLGGKADVFIRPTSLQAEQVKILTPDVDGAFVLSDDLGAVGDNKRPVVAIDAVRLLGPGPTFSPLDPPLNRKETELVAFAPLVTSGIYADPHAAFNTTLNQLSVVAIEKVSEAERYVVYGRFDASGVAQIPFTRISSSTLSASRPHVLVNPANGRAYIFWAEGPLMKAKVLGVAASALSTVLDTFTLIAGTDEIVGRIDSSLDADAFVHVVCTRRVLANDGSSQDNPWYAKVDANGAPPFPSFQLVFNTTGQNRDATVCAQGVGVGVLASIIWTAAFTDSSNLFGTQVNSTGTLVGDVVELTSGSDFNDQPTARPGPGDAIHVVWRQELNRIAYARFLNTDFGADLPPFETIRRPAETIDELRITVNPSGLIYAYWVELDGDFTDVFTVKLDGDGLPIGPVHDVTKTPYFSIRPTLVNDLSGGIHIVWLDGIRAQDRPFYTKRSPQEWHLVVDDPNFRFSLREKLKLIAEVPAFFGLGVDIQWSNLLSGVQSYVDSDDNRTIVASLLVKNQAPGDVTLDVKYAALPGKLDQSTAQALVEDYIEALVEPIEVSAIMNLLFANGAFSVTPFEVLVEVEERDGHVRQVRGNDTVPIPRGVFLRAKSITVTPK